MLFKNFEPGQFSLCVLLLLTGCATGVAYTPVEITPIASANQRTVTTLGRQTEFRLDTGYTRMANAGSRWQHIGTIAQGEVYKAHQAIFTLEGTHVHEAYLVIADGRLIGFYLPVERSFSVLTSTVPFPLSSTP